MEKKINMKDRVALVRAMEIVIRNLNDEDLIYSWFGYGVADGDIDEDTTDEEIAESYCEV